MDDEEREKLKKQREEEELLKKRERHLKQLDATKTLYINEIMRRSNF